MNIAVIGSGYVGLVSGTCFADFGFSVTCVDKDAQKIAQLHSGQIPIYEPGLEDLVTKNVQRGTLAFSTNLKESVAKADVVFIAVGTPTRRGDGFADLSYVYDATQEIAQAIHGYTVVVTKSTVPVGTGREVHKILEKTCSKEDFDVASNPEFLREGSAIDDFMRPDRVVVGTTSDRARQVMATLYRPLYLIETPVVYTSLETAELIKYAANAFLATKISFINEMADLCEKCGADIQDVAKGMGLDNRIGRKFLHPGPGYGGSCFPKDTLALVKTAQQFGAPTSIVEAVVQSNDRRKKAMVQRIIQAMGGSVKGKKIGCLGATFKPNTDDMRESPSLTILPDLCAEGAHVVVFDPQGEKEGKELLPQVSWVSKSRDAIQGQEALLILTEWNEFRALDPRDIKDLLVTPLVIDCRNIFDPKAMMEAGLTYLSIGRPAVNGAIQPMLRQA